MDLQRTGKCPECGREMPAKALSCPHCSVLLTESKRMRMMMTETQRIRALAEQKKAHKSHVASLLLMLGVFVSLLIGIAVMVFTQSGVKAAGAIAIGVILSLLLAKLGR